MKEQELVVMVIRDEGVSRGVSQHLLLLGVEE
jgi:hypothetical protein